MENGHNGDISDTNATITSLDDVSTNNDSLNSRNSTVILDNSPNTHRRTFIYDNSREYSEGQQRIMVIDSDDGYMPPLEFFQRNYVADANTSSESDEQENSVADSTGTELLDEPNYVPASTSSEPHKLGSCKPPSLCMGCKLHYSQFLPFSLPEAYRRSQNNSDTGKDEWMARATQYTFNWSLEVYSVSRQQSSEPEDNPMECLDNDPPQNPIYAIDPINDDSDHDVCDDTPYSSTTDSPKSIEDL